jgi:hypothetical protein
LNCSSNSAPASGSSSTGALCRLQPAAAPSPARAEAVALPPLPALLVVDGLWAALGTPRLCDEPAPVLLDAEAGAELELQFKRRFDAAGSLGAG